MRRLLFFFIFMVTLVPNSYSKIVYIDINLVLNQSEIGKILNDYINSKNNENTLKYKKVEAVLLNKEKSLIAQQNILDEGEFKKKLNLLSEEIKNFRKDKKQSLENLNNIKIENTKKILSFLNPIITNYVDKNSISLVIPKKNIVVGKTDLDITNKIISLLNDQKNILNLK
ncbi:MAG: hypothetical protein CMI79_00210 [Candidatus Pelagibacter sp.]|nr:hypothetical protein [Candidatus Pelagibacter sp.]